MFRCISFLVDFKYHAYRSHAVLQIITFTASLNKRHHERHITVRVYLIAKRKKNKRLCIDLSLYFDVQFDCPNNNLFPIFFYLPLNMYNNRYKSR